MFCTMRQWRICLKILVSVVVLVAWQPAWAAKNVIIMISDGAGCNTWLAASMYQGKVGKQVYDKPGWINYLVSTYPLNTSTYPTHKNQQDPLLVYDPAKYWDSKAAAWKISHLLTGQPFAGYEFATAGYTDSAAAATALASGVKTYNHAINWTDDNKALQGQTIAEIAKSKGKVVGVVTTVPWSHATPAGLGGAHNAKRDAYAEIANEMLNAPWLDVIMGAGHPRFDDNGKPWTKETSAKQWNFVGGEKTWNLLTTGSHPAGWKLVETKAEFEALIQEPSPPKKVLGTAQVANTLQYNRKLPVGSEDEDDAKTSTQETSGLAVDPAGQSCPFETPLNTNVPSLATMSRAAIHCLESHPDGFYLMIEGGAVDWANHGNDPGRMIEEQVDFIIAVEAVVQWIEKHGGWDETLLVLTADHETGMLWGPESDKVQFQALVDNGPGKLPGMKYHSKTHSNSLVPLYARGPNSSRFADHIRGTDKTAAKIWSVSGDYIDNTDIFAVLKAVVLQSDDLGKTHR